MKKNLAKILSVIMIGMSLYSIPASANTWFEYKDYDGNRITWGMYDDNYQWPEGWYYENSNWYYFAGQGLASQGLQTIDGKDYYFDYETCAMKHDEYVKVGGGRYGISYWANSDGTLDYNNFSYPQALYDLQ